MELVPHGKRHELMPRGVKLDLVDPTAPAIMCAQFGKVAVGLSRQLLHASGSDPFADRSCVRRGPFCVEGRKDFAEGGVVAVSVVVRHCRGLIEHLVRAVTEWIERWPSVLLLGPNDGGGDSRESNTMVHSKFGPIPGGNGDPSPHEIASMPLANVASFAALLAFC